MLIHPCRNSHFEHLLDHSGIIDDFRDIRFRVASRHDRNDIIDVINSVTDELKYLQTDRYVPTPAWESLLAEGLNLEKGLLLIAIVNHETIIGFARLGPDDDHPLGRRAGNIGIALLPSYRSMGIGAIILKVLTACAVELEYDVLTANILESNIRSRRLFTRCGFRKVKCRKIYLDFINDHVNELHYEWNHCVHGR
jgi:RimJ/RimL family protein N-acetyltransferase